CCGTHSSRQNGSGSYRNSLADFQHGGPNYIVFQNTRWVNSEQGWRPSYILREVARPGQWSSSPATDDKCHFRIPRSGARASSPVQGRTSAVTARATRGG